MRKRPPLPLCSGAWKFIPDLAFADGRKFIKRDPAEAERLANLLKKT